MKLTDKQQAILEFIGAFMREEGFPPTLREMAAHFGHNPRAIFDQLKALEKKGCLRRRSARSRDLELLWPDTKGTPPGLTRSVPILGRVAAGAPLLAVENIEGRVPLPEEWSKGEDIFFLRVSGDSMRDAHIIHGDLILVRQQPVADNGQIVVAKVKGDEATVKRFFLQEEQVLLKPENSEMQPLKVSPGDVEIIGVVVGVMRWFR